MLDNIVEPLTPEQVEQYKKVFNSMPVVAIPSENKEVAKALDDIARELKQIRHALERRR